MSDIKEQVNSIVNTLENPPAYCRDCELEQDDREIGDDCPECGEELGSMDAWSYVTDALDIEYMVSGDGSYLGARILVCFGGPNVWIDTRYNRVIGHWWADSHSAPFTDVMGLDDVCQELWECK